LEFLTIPIKSNNHLIPIHINLLPRLLKNMPKCESCKRELSEHTKDELIDCAFDITKAMKTSLANFPTNSDMLKDSDTLKDPHIEPKTCYFCNKEFEAHTSEERDNCFKKFVDKSINLYFQFH
jgi:protein-arginine kinase activator protein McsA